MDVVGRCNPGGNPTDHDADHPADRDEWFLPPSLGADELRRIAAEHFGIDGVVTRLRGEREQNALIESANGSFVVKVAGATEPLATLEFQNGALEHIAATDPTLPVPRLVPNRSGASIVLAEVGSAQLPVRVMTFLPGRTFDDLAVISPAGLRDIGAMQGRLAVALASFEHPAADEFMPWALDSGMLANAELWSMLATDARALLEPCRERVEAAVAEMRHLRRQVIHNDAHRGNLLRDATSTSMSPEAVTGIIDFGDLVTSATAADLGVSGASFVGEQPDPAEAFVEMVRGYHQERTLDTHELALVGELVLCRLVLSALMTDYQMRRSPHVAEAVAAERDGIHRSLRRWSAIDARALSSRLIELPAEAS